MTLHAYRELGGGRLALTRSADKFMDSLVPEDRVMADRIFMRLVRPGNGQDNVANRVRRQSLYNIGPCQHVDRVLDKLIEGRLIRLTGDSEADTEVEIAHEALVRNWDRLVMLLDRDRERITTGRRLEAKAAEWIRHGRGEAGLLKSVALLEAETWLASPDAATLVSDDLRALVGASRTAANAARRRSRRVRRVLVTMTCVSVALAVFAFTRMVEANRYSNMASEETKKAVDAKEVADGALIEARAAEGRADRARKEALDAKNRAEDATGTAERRAGLIARQKIQIEKLLEADRTKARLFDATSWADAAKKSLSDDPERSILLAVQAALLLELNGQALPPSVASTLHQAIQANRLRLALPGSSDVVAVAFSPDSRRIATASPTRITISDAMSGGRVASLVAASPAAIAYSWDSRQLAVAGKALQILDPQTGATIRTLADSSPAIDRLSFSPDGRYLAGIGAGGEVHLWTLSGNAYRLLEHDKNSPVKAVAFSPTGALIASAGGGTLVKIWAAETGEHIANVLDQPGVNDLVFHPDGQRLITASEDRSVRVARPLPLSSRNSDAEVARYELPTAVRAVGVSREGRVLAIGADGIVTTLVVGPGAVRTAGTLMRATAGPGSLTVAAQFALPAREAGTFRISPDGATLASTGSSSGVRLWNLDPGSGTILGWSSEPIASLSAVGRQAFVTVSNTGVVRLWSLEKPGRESVGGFEVPGAVMAVVSPDGSRAAFSVCTDGCRIAIYQTAARKLERVLPDTSVSDSLALNADGTVLLSTERDSVKLWDVSSAMPLGAPTSLPAMSPKRSPGQSVSATVFSPDGQQVAIGLMDGRIYLGQLKDRVLQPPALLASTSSPVLSLAFTQNGRQLAAGHSDRNIRIWNLAEFDGSVRAPERTLSAHAGSVKALAFSAGGNLLASGSYDKTVRVWNLDAPQLDTDVVTSVAGLSGISEIRFTDDSAAVIVGGDDGTVRLLPARLDGQLPSGLTALTRNLRSDECDGRWCEELQAAFGDIVEGNRLARLGDVKSATAKFTSAQRTLPGLPLNPADHAAAISSQAGAAALRQDLRGTISQAEVLARAARSNDANSLLERFDPASRFGRTDSLEKSGREGLTASLRELAQGAARNGGDEASIRTLLGLVRANDPSQNFDIDAETVSLVQSVTVSHALALLQAMRVSEALETVAKLRAAGATRTPFDTEHLTANLLCWRGSLGAADLLTHPEVRKACAAAVQLGADAGTKYLNGHRDSRGLNRARTGDIAGAIEDFRAFAEDTQYTEDQRAQRRRWIAMLDKGEDPFTADELRKLKP